MRISIPGVLDLSLFGNLGRKGSCNRRVKLWSVNRLRFGMALRTQPALAVSNKTNDLISGRRLKANRQISLDRDLPSVHDIGLELPLLHAVDGVARKGERSLQELGVLHGAVAANQSLQDYCALLALGAGGIGEGGLVGQQRSLLSFGNSDRLNRTHGSFRRLVAAGVGSHRGHLRLQARGNIPRRRGIVRLRLRIPLRRRLGWNGHYWGRNLGNYCRCIGMRWRSRGGGKDYRRNRRCSRNRRFRSAACWRFADRLVRISGCGG